MSQIGTDDMRKFITLKVVHLVVVLPRKINKIMPSINQTNKKKTINMNKYSLTEF